MIPMIHCRRRLFALAALALGGCGKPAAKQDQRYALRGQIVRLDGPDYYNGEIQGAR